MHNIDFFKQMALEGIQKLGDVNIYPIRRDDLLRINRCPLCNSLQLETIAEVYLNDEFNFFSTATCTSCMFTFRTISPNFRWFQKCWNIIKSDKLEVFNTQAEWYKEQRHIVYKNLITAYRKAGKLLEIGGGYGAGSNIFKQAGFEVEVIEAEPNKALYIEHKLKIPVMSSSIESFLDNPPTTYDIVVFSNCLEHLDHPADVISKIPKILNPDGIMLVSLPIIWDWVNWSDALYLTHKSNFTIENMNGLLAKNNFETLEMVRVPFFFDNAYETSWLVKNQPNPIVLDYRYKDWRKMLLKIKNLYRKGLAINSSPYKPLKYSVPYIDQFFQTLNLDRHRTESPEENHIVFSPIS